MENRRLLLAAFLSVLIVIGWSYLFPAPPVAPPTPIGESAPLTSPEGDSPGDTAGTPEANPRAPGEGEDSGEVAAAAETESEPAPLEIVQAESEERITLEDNRMRAVFTNRGAQLVSYQTKEHLGKSGEPLELIRARGSDLYPFAILEGEGGSRLNTALFVAEHGQDDEGRPWVTFRHSSEAGVAEKSFRWDDRGFFDSTLEVGGQVRDWGFLLGPGINDEPAQGAYGTGASLRAAGYLRSGESETLVAGDVEEEVFLSARGLDWVTLEDNYFLVGTVPKTGVAEILVRPVLQRPELSEDRPRFLPVDTSSQEDDLVAELLLLVKAAEPKIEITSYFGAKQYSYLTQLPYDFEESVRWGALGFLSKPLYLILEWIHTNFVPNYGWAIVLVTFLIKLVFFPLTHKSQESMGKMQELNPKVQAIRAKYRSKLKDKQGRPNIEAQRQMNEEVMGVYKSAGVNPASGCLPILLQMPVFFAFYRLLTTVVELRGAPWLLWVQDLSQPDPYWILPLVMGVTSLAMQRMMPSSPDPMQRRLMQLMPIMFTVFAFTFPSGLVLYWMTNNLLTMVQQAFILRKKARKAASE
ncbi:MAG: membrane protein insertase YidC [Acidobacteriota bacterium]